jgi:hypothetical protein
MNVELGTEAAQFLFGEYKNEIFVVAVLYFCRSSWQLNENFLLNGKEHQILCYTVPLEGF